MAKQTDSQKKAMKNYLSKKKSFNIYFDKEVYDNLRKVGLDTPTIREIIMEEYERRVTGKSVKYEVKKVIVRKGDIISKLDKLQESLNFLSDRLNVPLNGLNQPVETVSSNEEVNDSMGTEETYKDELEESDNPIWMD